MNDEKLIEIMLIIGKEKSKFLEEVLIESEFNERWVKNNPLTLYQK